MQREAGRGIGPGHRTTLEPPSPPDGGPAPRCRRAPAGAVRWRRARREARGPRRRVPPASGRWRRRAPPARATASRVRSTVERRAPASPTGTPAIDTASAHRASPDSPPGRRLASVATGSPRRLGERDAGDVGDASATRTGASPTAWRSAAATSAGSWPAWRTSPSWTHPGGRPNDHQPARRGRPRSSSATRATRTASSATWRPSAVADRREVGDGMPAVRPGGRAAVTRFGHFSAREGRREGHREGEREDRGAPWSRPNDLEVAMSMFPTRALAALDAEVVRLGRPRIWGVVQAAWVDEPLLRAASVRELLDRLRWQRCDDRSDRRTARRSGRHRRCRGADGPAGVAGRGVRGDESPTRRRRRHVGGRPAVARRGGGLHDRAADDARAGGPRQPRPGPATGGCDIACGSSGRTVGHCSAWPGATTRRGGRSPG